MGDDEFAAHQIEFIQRVFSYSAYLREHARETPVSDSFLIAFVRSGRDKQKIRRISA
ncbi:hypothetical protein BURMUCF2_B0271 [Burkholderia multivorans CF2]|nr:hypothetical protein BURMUCF2_B0271 [Burkholderia multivorans CF2]